MNQEEMTAEQALAILAQLSELAHVPKKDHILAEKAIEALKKLIKSQ